MGVATDTSSDDFNPMRRSIRIEARNFGPIANGVVDLRPLTVFVGPSNTGKTYMSILVYALHKSVGGFLPLPAAHPSVNFPYDLIGYGRSSFGRSDEPEVLRRTVCDLINILDQPPSGILIYPSESATVCRLFFRILVISEKMLRLN